MLNLIYKTYQLLFALPFLLVVTALTCLSTTIGCMFGKPSFWSYYPPMIWSRLMCWVLLLPVRVEGIERLDKQQSYVFVANHQGAYDIFLIYGFLGRNFKWMMKKSLRNIFLVGKACESAGHIFVDKSGPKAVQHTYENARHTLKDGISVVVFPEGARTFTGHMAKFRRGAFQLAQELSLPIVPVTVDGSFNVLPRQRGFNFVTWHPLRLVIHKPIMPDTEDIIQQSYDSIMSSLPQEYQGYQENKDQ